MMLSVAMIFGGLACGVWFVLLTARGGFWRAAQRDDAAAQGSADTAAWPTVAAVVPARDEADVIGATLASLLRQDYPGEFSITVVDDHSRDGTAARASGAGEAAAAQGRSRPLTIIAAPPLARGWAGKQWAVAEGIRHVCAQAAPAHYLLLTDADICHDPDTLSRLVRRAQHEGAVLASLMAKLKCSSRAERALIPAFIFFFQMLYPFAWVNRRDRPTAAAAGGCMLVRRDTLEAAGGVAAIRGELIDDCALARLLKPHGPIWIGLTERARSVRAYRSMLDIGRMVCRSAYTQLKCSPWQLSATIAAMAATFLAPPVLTLFATGTPQALGALAWLAMALAFQPTLRFYGVSRWWGAALPAIALAYLGFTLASAYQHMRGRGGSWKGRVASRFPG